MATRKQILDEARTWIGTPYHHQGRLKGVGVDCAGLIVMVGKELGLSSFDVEGYSSSPDPVAMSKYLHDNLDRVHVDDMQVGDVLWLKVEVDPQHLAIVTATSPRTMMIHSFSMIGVRKTVEHGLGDYWTKRVIGCFRYRGVDE